MNEKSSEKCGEMDKNLRVKTKIDKKDKNVATREGANGKWIE
jgi:hypothetical protein